MNKKYYDYLEVIKDYGLLSLPIEEFSKLLAIDLLSQRVIDIPNAEKLLEQEYDEKNHYKPLIEALQPRINDIENKLVKAVEKNEISTVYLMRDFDTEKVDSANTLISFDEFEKFLKIYDLDQYIIWSSDESEIGARFDKEVDIATEAVELIKSRKMSIDAAIQQDDIEELRRKVADDPEMIAKILHENIYLKYSHREDKQADTAKPLVAVRERETLLIILSALAKEANIDISKVSKSAALIERLTQQLGAAVGATTIERHLKQVPQALANRTK